MSIGIGGDTKRSHLRKTLPKGNLMQAQPASPQVLVQEIQLAEEVNLSPEIAVQRNIEDDDDGPVDMKEITYELEVPVEENFDGEVEV